MPTIDRTLSEYASAHTTPEPKLVQELVAASDRELQYVDMLSGRVVGRLLNMLVKLSGARRVLEVGTFTGYSALMMADALPEGGELFTCELNERYAEIARPFFERFRGAGQLHLIMGDALETISGLEGPFELVFLDADKKSYPEYYQAVLPLLPQDGVLVIDNVFWEGKVINPEQDKSLAIDRMNRPIAEDDRVEQVMLSVRDGVTIVRKK